MPQQLKYVAQLAMDNFYQQYKGEDDFWELEDFISMCGNTVAAMYMEYYKQEYGSLRQERKDEVITFDAGWLLEQEAEVKKNGIGLYAELPNGIMTFPYDKSSVGLQSVFNADTLDELERTSLGQIWELKYIPKTNRIFYYSDVRNPTCLSSAKIGIINKGTCNIRKIRVLYVPILNDENAPIPDGLISDAVIKTVFEMKQIANNNVVDQTSDQNSNKILQTELDKKTLSK